MKREKTILFLCKCNGNVSNNINFDKLKEWAKSSKEFDIIVTSKLLCSPKEKEGFSQILRKKNIKNVIIAGCSPKLHEKEFQEIAEKNNINMAKISMVNIREQCAWVTKNIDEATEKAISMINASVKRSRHSENIYVPTMKANNDVLIIGGGIAGIEASLNIASDDRKVYLVDKEITLGGSISKIEEIGPQMECSPCLMAPRLSQVLENKNIEIFTYSEIEDILGFFGNFTVKLKKKARFIEDSCIGCEECFDLCPAEVPSQFHEGLGNRKAVYTLFPGSVPATAVIDRNACKHFIDGSCSACKDICPYSSVNFDQQDEMLSFSVGSVVLATGHETYDLSSIAELNYKKIDNVYTTLEFERLACSNGPTGAQVKLKNGNPPQSVAVIHCAGSLRDDALPYCSGICCTNACKVGDQLRESNPGIKIYNIHKDLVFPSPLLNNFYHKQVKNGTEFINCQDLTSIKVNQSKDKIEISGKDLKPIKVDMVVLANGLTPSKDTGFFADMLSIDRTDSGFFQADHEILHATGANIDGVYIAGSAASPCNATSAVTQAQAAAGHILDRLRPGKEIELEPMVAFIDEDKCSGCKLCIATCPYKAISFNKEKKISEVNAALCHACGTCAAACPSGACTEKHYTDNEIYAEIGGILNGR